MTVELTNLLPRERVALLTRNYFFRLSTVGVLMLAAIVLINLIMLIPSYLFLESDIAAAKQNLAALDTSLIASRGTEVGARLDRVEVDAAYLARLEKQTTAAAALRGVLAEPHPSIAITGISFTAAATQGDDGKMIVSGTAATRDALRRYSVALSSLPFVEKADLPISAYAKDSDIPFSITLTGTFMP